MQPGPALNARCNLLPPLPSSPHPQGAWRTDEIRRQKPTPQDEMRGGMSYMNSVIFDIVPIFHRRIDTALASLGQPRLPLNHSLFK